MHSIFVLATLLLSHKIKLLNNGGDAKTNAHRSTMLEIRGGFLAVASTLSKARIQRYHKI